MPILGRTSATSSRKTRPSVQYCAEKYACARDPAVALFSCDQCGTNQCSTCEQRLHELARYELHDRHRLIVPTSDQLCENSSGLACEPRNLADVVCADCSQRRYCFDCDTKVHRARPLCRHQRVLLSTVFEPPPPLRELSDLVERCSPPPTFDDMSCHSPRNSDDSELFLSLTKSGSEMHTVVADKCVNKSGQTYEDHVAGTDCSQPALSSVATLPVNVLEIVPSDDSPEVDDLTDSFQASVLSLPFDETTSPSFLLLSQDGELQVNDDDEFLQRLHCDIDTNMRVVSIFGRTGSGKSHALNYTFFDGHPIFLTKSSDAMSVDHGAWAAYDAVHEMILLDTEGWLGVTADDKLHMRQLFIVLAVSDIVIIHAKMEHLHSDIFQFLSSASSAYRQHFATKLDSIVQNSNQNCCSSFLQGPAVVIFHETQYTDLLAKGAGMPCEKILRSRFADLKLNCDAFSMLQYVGTQTTELQTDFKGLLLAVKRLLRNEAFRSPRQPSVVFSMLKTLNERFSVDIENTLDTGLADTLLTCGAKCLVCSAGCTLSQNHEIDGTAHVCEPHESCKYSKQYDNRVFVCKTCFSNGKQVAVIPKVVTTSSSSWLTFRSYAWQCYELECVNCGVIYRTSEGWFGNFEPDKSTLVRTEIRHIWPGDSMSWSSTTSSTARRLLDSLAYVSDAVAVVGAQPTKVVKNWVTDFIAPAYWVPNSQLTHCHNCQQPFSLESSIHHCRACGQGFCDGCSSKRRPVPERNWGDEPVRVCDACYQPEQTAGDTSIATRSSSGDVFPRLVGEAIGCTVGTLAGVVSYPLSTLRSAARPGYWVPDEDIRECAICAEPFNATRRLHHCRACGEGVCDVCSPRQLPVPSRGWDYAVRVCKKCEKTI